MMNHVTLRVDVESMRYSAMQAIMDHRGEIERALNEQVEKTLTSENFSALIADTVRQAVDGAMKDKVKWAVSSAIRADAGIAKAIAKSVSEALSND